MMSSVAVPVRERTNIDPARVKAARLFRDITQAELAERMDVTVMTVSRRETGASPVTWEIWLGITHALELDRDWQPGVDPVAAIRREPRPSGKPGGKTKHGPRSRR